MEQLVIKISDLHIRKEMPKPTMKFKNKKKFSRKEKHKRNYNREPEMVPFSLTV